MLSHMLRAAGNKNNLQFIGKTVLALTSNASSTIAINTPAGTQSGDIIIAVSTSINRSNGHTATGFTQWFYCGAATGAGSVPKTTVLYNILAAAPSASYSFTITGGYGNTVYLALFTFRPVGGTVSVGNFARNTTTPSASTTATAPDVTGTAGQTLFRLYSLPNAGTWGSIPGNYTVIDNTGTANSTLLINQTAPSTGAQGTQAVTFSVSSITNVASFFINVA